MLRSERKYVYMLRFVTNLHNLASKQVKQLYISYWDKCWSMKLRLVHYSLVWWTDTLVHYSLVWWTDILVQYSQLWWTDTLVHYSFVWWTDTLVHYSLVRWTDILVHYSLLWWTDTLVHYSFVWWTDTLVHYSLVWWIDTLVHYSLVWWTNTLIMQKCYASGESSGTVCHANFHRVKILFYAHKSVMSGAQLDFKICPH